MNNGNEFLGEINFRPGVEIDLQREFLRSRNSFVHDFAVFVDRQDDGQNFIYDLEYFNRMEQFFSNLALSNKFSYRIGRHFLFWTMCAVFFGTIYGSVWNYGPKGTNAYVEAVMYLPLHMFLSYMIIYFLFPRYLFTGKYLSLATGIVILIPLTAMFSFLISLWWITPYRETLGIEPPSTSKNIFHGFMAGLRGSNTVAGFVAAIKLLKHWYFKKEENTLLEKQKLKAELEVLKAQLQPHFLFNTLNNLYSLILQQSKQAPEVVLKLSELLRYILAESAKNKILLTRELSILKNYISLEQIRFGNRLDMTINIQGDLDNKLIAPLLFLPLVENAFKHGAKEMLEQPWMSLDIIVNENNLKFKLINSNTTQSETNSFSSGIGLQNLEKRLSLLYSGKHELRIVNEGESFLVSLQLELETNGQR